MAEPLDALVAEYLRCDDDPIYFLRTYAQLLDTSQADGGAWVPFELWPGQWPVVEAIHSAQRTVILKARQLGISWLAIGYALWSALFRPAANILLYSRRDDEAVHMLDERLKGMYRRLPSWLRAAKVVKDDTHHFALSNGSVIRAFPTTAGDSYTATMAVVDEADLVPNLEQLLRSVKPTIDGGGKLVLLSRADKSRPHSEFKRIFQAARAGKTPWRAVFLPWTVRPERDAAWYASQCADALARSGNLDAVHEQYPASPEEALAPGSAGKRLPAEGLLAVYEESTPIPSAELPPELAGIAGLRVYKLPVSGRRYRIGADPAEGLPGPSHDDSALSVVDAETGEQVAAGSGRWEPKHEFPRVITAVSGVFNAAAALVERNNHGHATIGSLESAGEVSLLLGADGRAGYPKSPASKTQLWDSAWAEIQVRRQARLAAEEEGDAPPPPLIRDPVTFAQLASLESATCKAPPGDHDDDADAWGLTAAGVALVRIQPLMPGAPDRSERAAAARARRRNGW